jgi:gentisate 1,2-dioxygenase
MKILYLFIFIFTLTSCRTCYEEVWCMEKYPMEWNDVIIKPEDHWHFKGKNNEWSCIELEADTIYLEVQDTMYIERLDFVYYKKEKR